jgi:hypothetical protein
MVTIPPITLEGAQNDRPLYFIENQGQMDEEVAFYVQGLERTLYFTASGMVVALDHASKGRWFVKIDFQASNKEVEPRGHDRQEAVLSYFRGGVSDWKTGLPTFGRLTYPDLWPGIDLVFTGKVNRLKYEFIVQPGADPGVIRFAYQGVDALTVENSGALTVVTPAGTFQDGAPLAYQCKDGEAESVDMGYELALDNGTGAYTLGFALGDYDKSRTIILDPSMLVFCGYIGGWEYEEPRDLALDALGFAYITGFTQSTEISFPVNAGPDLSYNGGKADAFVAKLSTDGTTLLYCGYIGGLKSDYGFDIDVDPLGFAYVTGYTESKENTFPVLVGPDLTYNGGDHDAFVAKVNPSGTSLVYCGYIGGEEREEGQGIAVDADGRACITGLTISTEDSFPVAVGPDLTYNGYFDAFVARVASDGRTLEYCGYIGGSENDFAFDVDLDGAGHPYLAGWTYSKANTFPVIVGPDLSHNGGSTDTFVAKVALDGTTLEYCGYIGGAEFDQGQAIAVDDGGCAYVVGWTESPETSFPVKIGPDLSYNGWYWDGYVAKVNGAGTGLDYCGYIGGDRSDHARAVDVDSQGRAYIAGYTHSTESSFPVFLGPGLMAKGSGDVFVSRVHSDGSGLEYCGFIGGTNGETGEGIGADAQGCALVTGTTYSNEVTFPVTKGPDLSYNGDGDCFVAKVAPPSFTADVYTLPESTGGAVNLSLNAGAANGNRKYLVLGSVSGFDPGILLPGGQEILPLNWDPFTLLVADLLNSSLFQHFLGTLDGAGQAQALFDTQGPLPSGLSGLKLYFAFALNNPWDFASNPVVIEIVP